MNRTCRSVGRFVGWLVGWSVCLPPPPPLSPGTKRIYIQDRLGQEACIGHTNLAHFFKFLQANHFSFLTNPHIFGTGDHSRLTLLIRSTIHSNYNILCYYNYYNILCYCNYNILCYYMYSSYVSVSVHTYLRHFNYMLSQMSDLCYKSNCLFSCEFYGNKARVPVLYQVYIPNICMLIYVYF